MDPKPAASAAPAAAPVAASGPLPSLVSASAKPIDDLQFHDFKGGLNEEIHLVPPPAAPLSDAHLMAPVESEEEKRLLSGAPSSQPPPPPSGQPAPAAPASNAHFYELEYWSEFFQVETGEVLSRLRIALFPKDAAQFLVRIGATADLYGPIWISTTLIVLLGMMSNVASYAQRRRGVSWKYDFSLMVWAAMVIYTYSIFMPVIVWVVFRYHSVPARVVEVACAYGYAWAPFVLASVLCFFPWGWIRWTVMSIAVAVSLAFLILSLRMLFDKMQLRKFLFISIFGLLHIIVALVFKLFFFGPVEIPL